MLKWTTKVQDLSGPQNGDLMSTIKNFFGGGEVSDQVNILFFSLHLRLHDLINTLDDKKNIKAALRKVSMVSFVITALPPVWSTGVMNLLKF
jgi:hypothetical protein